MAKAKLKLNPDIIRQGDVTLVRVAARPRWAKEAKRDTHDRVVAAHGEQSGHGHAFRGAQTLGFTAQTREMAALAGLDYFEVGGAGDELKHEFADGSWTHEHKTAPIPSGNWERAVQVDDDAEEVKVVID